MKLRIPSRTRCRLEPGLLCGLPSTLRSSVRFSSAPGETCPEFATGVGNSEHLLRDAEQADSAKMGAALCSCHYLRSPLLLSADSECLGYRGTTVFSSSSTSSGIGPPDDQGSRQNSEDFPIGRCLGEFHWDSECCWKDLAIRSLCDLRCRTEKRYAVGLDLEVTQCAFCFRSRLLMFAVRR